MKDNKEFEKSINDLLQIKYFENVANKAKLDDVSDLYICPKTEIENAQLGYRYNLEGKYNENWIGKDYYVIGFDELCGDPIIIDIKNKDYPIYFMIHDDCSSLQKMSSNISNFISILQILNNNISVEEKLSKIKSIDLDCYNFWNERIGYSNIEKDNINKLPLKNRIIDCACIVLFILLFIFAIIISIN